MFYMKYLLYEIKCFIGVINSVIYQLTGLWAQFSYEKYTLAYNHTELAKPFLKNYIL